MADTVDHLLRGSRAAHLAYRAASPHMRSLGGAKPREVAGDPVQARLALETAAALRQQANDLDVAQQDQAWTTDEEALGGVDHDDLVTFYGEMLAQPSPVEAALARRNVRRAHRDAVRKGIT